MYMHTLKTKVKNLNTISFTLDVIQEIKTSIIDGTSPTE